MGFGSAIKSVLSQYANFSGRARRSEFWFFYLFTQLVTLGGFMLVGVIAVAVLPTSEGADPSAAALAVFFVALGLLALATLALIIPTLSVWVRRLHDMGQSGHWLWLNLVSLGIVPFIMAFIDSQPTTNQWGPDPKAADRVAYGGYGQPQGGFPPPQ